MTAEAEFEPANPEPADPEPASFEPANPETLPPGGGIGALPPAQAQVRRGFSYRTISSRR